MNPAKKVQESPPPILPAIVYNELRSYLRESGSTLSPSDDAISPHQLAKQVAGDGLNAWREIWVLMPGQKRWANAGQLRAQLGRQTAAAPATPAESMKIAAKAMSDALSTALTLVAHANDQAQNTLERRLPKYRRAWDTLEDVD